MNTVVLSLGAVAAAFLASVSYCLCWRSLAGEKEATAVVSSSAAGESNLSFPELVSLHDLNTLGFVSHYDSHAQEERRKVSFPRESSSHVDIDRASKHADKANKAKSLATQRSKQRGSRTAG